MLLSLQEVGGRKILQEEMLLRFSRARLVVLLVALEGLCSMLRNHSILIFPTHTVEGIHFSAFEYTRFTTHVVFRSPFYKVAHLPLTVMTTTIHESSIWIMPHRKRVESLIRPRTSPVLNATKHLNIPVFKHPYCIKAINHRFYLSHLLLNIIYLIRLAQRISFWSLSCHEP